MLQIHGIDEFEKMIQNRTIKRNPKYDDIVLRHFMQEDL
jgi:hypothetical protein